MFPSMSIDRMPGIYVSIDIILFTISMDTYMYQWYNINVRWRRRFYISPPPLPKKKEGVPMPDEKKSRYTEAQKKASAKYLKESVEDIRIRVPKGDKAKVQEHAASMGESMNSFVVRAINEAMERDKTTPQ